MPYNSVDFLENDLKYSNNKLSTVILLSRDLNKKFNMQIHAC